MLKITQTNRAPLMSLPDLIASELRQAIVRGEISPGEALRQEEIAVQFNTSRIPVREALRQLQAEGLVALHSNKGAIVTVLSADDVRELFEIRLLLEPSALRHALPHHTPDTWSGAKEILQKLDNEAELNPLSDNNRDFHVALYTPANRPILLEMIESLFRKTDRYGRKTEGLASRHAKAQAEHRQLLDACEHGDADGAVLILSQHITA
jgi:DNA-binding GntR family transcriptional regulator